jgi:hypothetical protein
MIYVISLLLSTNCHQRIILRSQVYERFVTAKCERVACFLPPFSISWCNTLQMHYKNPNIIPILYEFTFDKIKKTSKLEFYLNLVMLI